MTTRTFAILAAALVAFGAFAGCIGGEKEGAKTDPVDKNSVPGNTGSTPGGTTPKPQLTVLAPLVSTLTLDAPAWVASGTEVPVKLTAPSNGKAPLSYAWAIGALPGTTTVSAVNMDTGSKGPDYIQPGATKSLTFKTAGVYGMHCHPHPYMRHNVTVIDGYAGPKSVDVFIVDGATPNDNRYVPENIVIGTNTTVNYKNVGEQPHTATGLGAQEPALKLLPLKADTGAVKVEGNGWQRVVAVVQDSEGRLGIANASIYVTPTLPAFETKTIPFEFTYGAPATLAGTPAEAAAKSEPVTLEQPGLVTINYTFSDAPYGAGAPENLAEVEIHFTKDGETQDTQTAGPEPTGSLSGKAIAGAYTLKVIPLQGVKPSGTVTIEVVYDLVPPAPAAPAPASNDGHGGHVH